MTAGELHDLLVTALVRQYGGSKRAWRAALGPLRVHDPATHPHCNWSASPSGSSTENAAIERLQDELRGQYPLVTGD